jgi:DNA-binding transcriptional LysR family regulator
MINFYQLKTFVTVIGEGSMTGAADKLYLTQPAVSQQIRSLEEELGVDLLVRGVRQVKPTLQGELLFEHAKKILQMVQQAEINVKSMGAQLNGNLKVGSLNSIGLHIMSGVFSKVLKHNPGLFFQLEYGRAEELLAAFKAGTIDAIITPDLVEEYKVHIDDLDGRLLQKEEMWLVASGRELDVPKQITLKEYGQLPVVEFSDEYPQFNSKLKSELNKFNVEYRKVFQSSNVGTLKRVIESGLGWGFLPSHSIKKQVKLGRLIRVHVDGFSYQTDIKFYYTKSSANRKILDVFYNALQSQEKS